MTELATIGVSTERGVVRAVLLSAASSDGIAARVLRRGAEHPTDDTGARTAAAVASVLNALDADLGPDVDIEGTAVAYRDADERRAIVSLLASGRWRASSLVSAKSAHLAAVREIPGLDEFGSLLVYESVPGYRTLSVVDADRTSIAASESIASQRMDSEAIGASVRRGWALLDSVATKPDAVVLLGSLVDDPDVVSILELGFAVPVVHAPESSTATAVGAALLAAVDAPAAPAVDGPVPTSTHRGRRRFAVAAAAAAALAAGTVGAVAMMPDSAPSQSISPGATVDANPPLAPVPSLAPNTPEPVAVVPPADAAPADTAVVEPPVNTAAVDPPPRYTSPPAPVVAAAPAPVDRESPPTDVAPPPTASPAPAPAPAPAPTPTTVGAPNANWLFPGESPPPPLGADPAATQQWWDNHWALKDRWLHGR